MSDPFDPDVVAAVRRHMNEDHAEDCVVICRGLGGRPDAASARMADMSPDGIRFAVEGPDGDGEVTVTWSQPIEQRAQVRSEVTDMYRRARLALGLPEGE